MGEFHVVASAHNRTCLECHYGLGEGNLQVSSAVGLSAVTAKQQ